MSARLDPQTSFVVRTLLIHEFRRIVLTDPDLPDSLLPQDWPGHAAFELTKALYAKVAERSTRYRADAGERSGRAAGASRSVPPPFRPLNATLIPDVEPLETAEADALSHRRRSHQLQFRKSLEQRGDRHLAFDARERHADTRVDAAREREVMIRRAFDVEPFRIFELRRVAIRGADAQRDLGTGLERDAADLRRCRHFPIAELVRAGEAQRLFDCAFDRCGSFAQLLPRAGLGQKAVHAVADQVGGGFVPCIEQEDAVVQQLGFAQFAAVV